MIRANKDMVNLSITVIILYWTEYIDIEFRNIKTVMVNLSSLNKWSLSQWWLLAFVSRFVLKKDTHRFARVYILDKVRVFPYSWILGTKVLELENTGKQARIPAQATWARDFRGPEILE